MAVDQIVERGLAELVEGTGHRDRVVCATSSRVHRRQGQGERPDGRLESPAADVQLHPLGGGLRSGLQAHEPFFSYE